MRRCWTFLPNFVRWLLVTVLVIAVVGGAAYAYKILTITGEVTVKEAISVVGDTTFSFSLYPQESASKQFTLANASSISLDVSLNYTCTPAPGNNISVTLPNKVSVPATGQANFTVQVTASKSAEPKSYSISIDIER